MNGPKLRYDYNIWVVAKDTKRKKVLLGGLGGMGIGQMWLEMEDRHKQGLSRFQRSSGNGLGKRPPGRMLDASERKKKTMKISAVIAKLKEIKSYMGDVDVVVDTEAGTFPCHEVNVEDVLDNVDLVDAGEKPICIIHLDHKIMRKVHPPKSAGSIASWEVYHAARVHANRNGRKL